MQGVKILHFTHPLTIFRQRTLSEIFWKYPHQASSLHKNIFISIKQQQLFSTINMSFSEDKGQSLKTYVNH